MIDRSRLVRTRDLGFRFLFGDRVGLLLFLASLCLFVTLWRTEFLINDSHTIANGLYAVAHGDISLTVAEYGSLRSPGTNLHSGSSFSRNYGVIVLSLPFLYGLRALGAVSDLRVALIALWSLLLFVTIVLTGRQLDRRQQFTVGGGAFVVALFVGNVALATPMTQVSYHLLALQLFHMTVAAFAGPLAYRLVSATDSKQLGLVAAVLVIFGTPLAFWASVPKRHVITAVVALGVAFSLLYSRDPEQQWSFEVRALSYVMIALLAWIHAPEALVLFVVFVVIDVSTAPHNDLKTVGLLGGVFLVALLPLFVTNTLISGDPLTVPRMLKTVNPGADISLTGASQADGGSSGGGSSGTGLPVFVVVSLQLLQSAFEPIQRLFDLLLEGTFALVTEPTDAYRALIRSGYIETVADRAEDTAAANLSLLESGPILGAVAAVVPTALVVARRSYEQRSLSQDITTADVFLVCFTVALSLVYIASLPLHAQVTVRYLFPVGPLLAVLVVRLLPIRRSLATHWKTTLWSTAGGILIGGQIVLVSLTTLRVGRGEAFQVHALIGIGIAGLLAAWCLLGWTTDRLDRIGAALVGLATATSTIFVLFAAVEYFGLGGAHALPMVRVLADLLPIG